MSNTNTFVKSMKTIAESLIRKAGFDKTRTGRVVGKNTLTKTYTVKVDGYVYNNVPVINDSTYNVGDTVRVNIPVNQPSQIYITGSIFSDVSIGKKIAHAQSLIDAANEQIGSILVVGDDVYQLRIESDYRNNQATHTASILKNGTDVITDADDQIVNTNTLHWYLMKSDGANEITQLAPTFSTTQVYQVGDYVMYGSIMYQCTTAITVPSVWQSGYWTQVTNVKNRYCTLDLTQYLYGQALELRVLDSNSSILMKLQVILFDNDKVTEVEETASQAQAIAANTDQYFWHTTTGTDTGTHITEVQQDTFTAQPSGNNLLARSNGVAIRNGTDELAVFKIREGTVPSGTYLNAYINGSWQQVAAYTENYAQIGATSIDNKNIYLDPANGMYIRNGTNNMASYLTTGMTLYNANTYPTMYAGNNGFKLYDGTTHQYEIASITSDGMVLKNTSNTTIFSATPNALNLYTTGGVNTASFSSGGITLNTINGYKTFEASANAVSAYTGTNPNRTIFSLSSSGLTTYNSNGYATMSVFNGGLYIYDGSSSLVRLMELGTSGMTLRDNSNNITASFTSSGSLLYSSGYLAASFGDSGVSLYAGGNLAATYSGTGVSLYANGNITASFTSSAATIYSGTNNTYTQMTASAFSIYQQGQQVANINASGATFTGSSAELSFTGYGLYFSNLSGSTAMQFYATAVASSMYLVYGNLAASISYGSNNELLIYADGGNDIAFINSIRTNGDFNANRGDFHGEYGHTNTSSAATNTRYTDGYNLRRTTNTSSIRFKNSVSEVIEPELNPEHLYDINIVQYKYNSTELNDPFDKRYGKYLIGYIAEQVREVYPIAVDVDAKGHAQAVNTHFLIPAMLALIQSQNKRIVELERKVS